jgi:hypothetical protein
MDLTVVYKTTPESVSGVINALRKEGFNPVSLGNPSGTNIYASGGSYKVQIAVPRDEVPGAESFLRRWDETRRPEVAKLAGGLRSQFLMSVLLFIPVLAVFWLFTDLPKHVALLTVIWIVIFALTANAKRIRERLKAANTKHEQEGGGLKDAGRGY